MKRQWRLLLTAISFFTRLPVPMAADFEEQDLNHAARYFPLVGLLVGAIGALVYWLAEQLLPPDIAILASMATTIYVTGAFHEDGLADAADGLGGGWEKEQVLTIMQDSRIGSYGAVALVMMLLAKFTALSHISPILLPWAMIAGHALSRFAAVLVIYRQRYVREAGKAKPLATQLTIGELVLAGMFGLLPLLCMARYASPLMYILPLLMMILVWWWFSAKLKKRLGGYTGDCLGAMQQLCELAFYLGILAASRLVLTVY